MNVLGTRSCARSYGQASKFSTGRPLGTLGGTSVHRLFAFTRASSKPSRMNETIILPRAPRPSTFHSANLGGNRQLGAIPAMNMLRLALVTFVVSLAGPSWSAAQDLYEIQVYPYETVEPGHTMLEFHTNFIPSGTKTTEDGVYANHHQFHVTMEVTHGFTPFFETGFYLETAPYVPDAGAKFTGWHVRPRFRIPEAETFPFKVSISLEYAFNQTRFEPNSQ